MNVTCFVGVVTLTTGLIVLLSVVAIGPQRMMELTGVSFIGLYPLGALSTVLGAVAVYTSILEERETLSHRDEASG